MFKADSAYSTKAEPGRGAPPLPCGRLWLSGGLWRSLGGLAWAGASSRAGGQKAALLVLFFVRSLFPFALSPSPCSRLPFASAGVGAGAVLWCRLAGRSIWAVVQAVPLVVLSVPLAVCAALCRLCGLWGALSPLAVLCASLPLLSFWGCLLWCWCRLCGVLGRAGQWCWVLGWC